VETATAWISLACALAAIALGAWLLRAATDARRSRIASIVAWSATLLGYGWVGILSLAFFTGRFGPDKLWFRSPVFYACAALLAAGAAWWFTRKTPARIRLGVPAAALVVLGAIGFLLRVDGRSTPLAMMMPTMNARAPDLTYFDAAGKRRSLSELDGKVVLLNFWATWCAPCRREMPLLSKMQREHSDDGFVVLYVSLEEPAVLEEFLAENRFDGIHGRLDRAPDFYDAGKFYPLSYLIGRDGEVAERWSGRPDEAWLSRIIDEQLAARRAPRLRSSRVEHDVPAREQ
jgi:thiol-disulfide isomerase/thioredoxin